MNSKSATILTESESHLIPEIVKIHSKALPATLLFNLGKNYLNRYYKSCFENPNTHLIYIREDTVLGYIFMSDSRLRYSSFLNFFDILTLSKNIFFKPILVIDIVKLILTQYELKEGEIEIAQFAVDNSHQSKGIGKNILQKTMQTAKKNGKSEIITVTHNLRLIDFYKSSFEATIFKRIYLHKQCYYWLRWKI